MKKLKVRTPSKSLLDQKQSLRNKIALLKKTHSPKELLRKSRQIKKALFETQEFKKAGTILFYASMKGEVQTKEMIHGALRMGKQVAVPKIRGNELRLYSISGWGELKKSRRGIPEPMNAPSMQLKKIGLIILPGLAFDRFGNRLGRGKGYYDRLLSKAEKPPRIGLAFAFQALSKIPHNSKDQKVHKILTEKEIIDCKKGQGLECQK